jgi:hypothetical protein
MSSVILTGDTSGTITVSAPAVAGSNTVTLPAATGTISLLQMGTAVASTSGTSIDFTNIPSWAKRITVMFNAVSGSGTSAFLIQLGDSGGIENTGYISAANYSTSTTSNTTGFVILYGVASAAETQNGSVVITNISGNSWVSNGSTCDTGARVSSSAGSKTLSDVLDRVRITTVNGTDTFDAGTINVMWEG